jgi:hypothetical protein
MKSVFAENMSRLLHFQKRLEPLAIAPGIT